MQPVNPDTGFGLTVPSRLLQAMTAVEHLQMAFSLLGANLDDPHFKDTPRRVGKHLKELFTPAEDVSYTLFENDDPASQMVVESNIRFVSWCSHHLLPFEGVAHIGYLPDTHIVGLSKIPRCVQKLAKAPQVQERLTLQILEELVAVLSPRGLAVMLEAEHSCMSTRGVKASGVITTTCKLYGNIDKSEFLEEVSRHRGR